MAVTEANVALIKRMVQVLKTLGVTVEYEPGWETRYTNTITLNPYIMYVHHTGADGTPASTIRDGHSTLPGPLSQFYGPRNRGRAIRIIAAGYANHAGKNDATILNSLKDLDVDIPGQLKPDGDDTYGNRYALGVEFAASGAFTADQYYVAKALGVAFAVAKDAHKDPDRDGKRIPVIGHKEATSRKIDPVFDMGIYRAECEKLLSHYLDIIAIVAEPAPVPTAPVAPVFVPLAITKVLDKPTVKAMQTLTGVPVADRDGIPGPQTYEYLQKYLNKMLGASTL